MADVNAAKPNPTTEIVIKNFDDHHNIAADVWAYHYIDAYIYIVFWVARHYKEITWDGAYGIALTILARHGKHHPNTIKYDPQSLADAVRGLSEEDQNRFFQSLIAIDR